MEGEKVVEGEGAVEGEEAVEGEDVVKVEDELIKLREENEKLRNKDMNFEKLRKKVLTVEELDKKQEDFKNTIINGHLDDALAVVAGDDGELRKKILHHYDRIKGEAITKEDINKRVKEAFLLETGGQWGGPNIFRGAIGYDSGGKISHDGGGNESDSSKEIRKTMGISDEDRKKYSDDKWEPSYK